MATTVQAAHLGTGSETEENDSIKMAQVVELSYKDLCNNIDLSDQVRQAFGKDGIGLLAVTGLPETYVDMCNAVHHVIRKFAALPKETKDKFEIPPFYQRGWDHGHELMKDGHPDLSKGSYYFNPVKDSFPDVEKSLVEKYPTFYGDNIFPYDDVPDFEAAVKRCSKYMQEVAKLVARQCDKIFPQPKSIGSGEPGICEQIVKNSKHHACRGLYYFPANETSDSTSGEDGWCGWHNDHCLLTGLIPGQFYNEMTGKVCESPDPKAGLYVCTRSGEVMKPNPPKNAMLFQIGETAQILSGGELCATPHMVHAPHAKGIARTTMPLFLEPGHDFVMSLPQFASMDVLSCPHLPQGVPTLNSRFSPNITFGDFGNVTFKAYYNLK